MLLAQSGRNPLAGARLTASIDTMDTYQRQGTGPITRGRSWIVEIAERGADNTWVLTSEWHDSANVVSSVGTTRSRVSDLRVVFDGVRATTDSAAVLFGETHASGWVVPSGEGARLYDGPLDGPRYDPDVAARAMASLRRPGALLVLPGYNLYQTGPLVLTTDTLRVTEAVLQDGARPVRALAITRSSGTTIWVDAATGRLLARRGSYGGGRFNWFHARRGITPPA